MVGERTVRVHRAAQDESGLLCNQTSEPGRPLVLWQQPQFGAQGGGVRRVMVLNVLERFGEVTALNQGCQPWCPLCRNVTCVGAVVAQ